MHPDCRFQTQNDRLSKRALETDGNQAFLFSTSGIQRDAKVARDHRAVRDKLQSKGYKIIGEFSHKRYNTNSFLQYFGGMNKGKPDSTDLKNAREFAIQLLHYCGA